MFVALQTYELSIHGPLSSIRTHALFIDIRWLQVTKEYHAKDLEL